MVELHLLEVDGELGICRSHNVLYLKLGVLDREAHLLDDSGILATGQLALLLRPRSRDHHFAAAEDEPCGFGVAEPHYHSCEPIRIVLGCFTFPGDLFEV